MRKMTCFLLGIMLGLTPIHFVTHTTKNTVPVVRRTGYPIHHQAIDRMKTYTVLLANEGFLGHSRGTGVIIDSTHVLTCAHMIENPDVDMWVYVYPGERVLKGKVVIANRGLDLAILTLNQPVHYDSYPVFQEHYQQGEPITIIGNMLGSMNWMVTYGIVSASMPHYLLTDGLIHGGNSGGPWINEAGEIVALTDWGLTKSGVELGVSGGVSAETINKFLSSWKHPSALELFLGRL